MIDNFFIQFTSKNGDEINKTLFKFFIAFSRFEYALKKADYLVKNDKCAKADWDKFAKEIASKFKKNSESELEEAVNYFINNPPKKQINKEGKLSWNECLYDEKDDIKNVLRMIRRVRNNLFHGGKFPSGPIQDSAKDKKLLNYSLIILNKCLELAPKEIQKYYITQD